MRTKRVLPNTTAVTEVIGSFLLILIAILVFSAIYMYIFPLPSLDADTHVEIEGYVNSNGVIILEHVGGESISSYRIDVRDLNGTLLDSKAPSYESWCIGGKENIASTLLLSEDDKVRITIYNSDRDKQEIVFDGLLQGTTLASSGNVNSSDPYLISSLLSDSSDEDLICFNKTSNGETINATFDADSYVYNWLLNGNTIASVLYPMDGNNATDLKDYSGNDYHATIHGASWIENGRVGGSYQFDGDDYISVPYCFDNTFVDDITVEVWIKTTNETGSIFSFNRSSYVDLSVVQGNIKWTVSTNSATVELQSSGPVNDGSWHLITATYESTTGLSEIYIDGILNVSITGSPGESLGVTEELVGYIGRSINPLSIEQSVIFTDDFETDKGWTIDSTYWWMNGIWERGIPVNDSRGDPPTDYDGSGHCYVTENERDEDVDYASTYLISPTLDMSHYDDVFCSYAVWYTNDYGNSPNNDIFEVYISNNGGSSWVSASTIGPDTPLPYRWIEYSLNLSDFITLTDSVKICFEASDLGSGSVVEAAVDAVNITGIAQSEISNFTGNIDEISVYPVKLSEEQIYQNYLCKKSGLSALSVLVSEQTSVGQQWSCLVTPVNETVDASAQISNTLLIKNYGGG